MGRGERFHALAGGGGLVTVIITFTNPKFVDGNDTKWQSEGHDACRTGHTSASANMEWCVRDPSQVRVIDIQRVHEDERV